MDFCLALPSSYISLLLKSVSNILPAGNTNFPSMFQSYSKACIEYFTSCSGSLLLLFKITNYDAYVGILHMQTCQAFIETKMRKLFLDDSNLACGLQNKNIIRLHQDSMLCSSTVHTHTQLMVRHVLHQILQIL